MNSPLFSSRNFLPFIAGLGLILVSLACGLGGAAPSAAEPPAPAVESTQPALPGGVQPTSLPESTAIAVAPTIQPQPAINESRRLTLEFPPKIKAGDSDVIRLTLEVDSLGNLTPTAQITGNTVTGETVVIPNLYDTHKVTAEARLDLAGVDVKPADLISEPLSPGQSATFFWSIRPQEVGKYRGTAWLYLRFVDKSSGEESRMTVSAQLVEIESVNFLGLSANLARTTGAVGSLIGGVIGFPFLEDIVKFVFRKRKK